MRPILLAMGFIMLGASMGAQLTMAYLRQQDAAVLAALERRVDELCGAGTLLHQTQFTTERCPISVLVGKGLDVSVTIPNFSKKQLVEMYGEFFGHGPGREDAHQQQSVSEQFAKAKQLSLIITTKCPGGEQ